MFCDGFCDVTGTRSETEKVCRIVDCGKYTFPLQVYLSPLGIIGVKNGSFAALQGVVPYIKHLASPTRIPFTAAYFGSLGLTLYFAVGVCFPLKASLTVVTF